MSNTETKQEEVKGQSGWKGDPANINRAGGPPKTHWWSQLYMDELERDSRKQEGLKKKEAIVRATVEKAEEGEQWAVKEVGDRVAGKAPQGIELGGTGEDGAIEVKIRMV